MTVLKRKKMVITNGEINGQIIVRTKGTTGFEWPSTVEWGESVYRFSHHEPLVGAEKKLFGSKAVYKLLLIPQAKTFDGAKKLARESIRFEMSVECAGKPNDFKINWLVERLAFWIASSICPDDGELTQVCGPEEKTP